MTAATATLIARTHPAFDARHAVLRFERGPVRGLPQAAGGRWSWYTRGVTQQTLAAQIRQLAAQRGYDKLDNAGKIAVRNEIAEQLGATRQAVYKALKQNPERQGKGGGAPRIHSDRCPLCEQALLTHAAHDAIERNLPEIRAKRKR